MIKIEHPELDKIAEEYFNLIKKNILERAKIFEMILEQILNQKDNLDKLAKENWGTIKSFTKLLFKNEINLVKADELNGEKERKQELENKLKQGIKKKWINDDVIQLCQYLSQENNIKDIIVKRAYQDTNTILLKVIGKREDKDKLDEELFVVINKIIDYDILENTKKVNNDSIKISYWLTQRLGVNTCPYCNRTPIHTVFDSTKSNKELIKPTLDHFYPKSKNPFLALSFYNLIPSCYYCNSSLKGSKDMDIVTHLNPYIDGFGEDAKFSFLPVSLLSPQSNPDNYKITLAPNKEKGLSKEKQRQIFGDNSEEGNVNLFKLEEIYQVHRDLVGELVVKAEVFKAQQENIRQFYQALSTNDSELYQFYFGNYLDEQDHNKRPLAKLTKDIVTEIIPNHF